MDLFNFFTGSISEETMDYLKKLQSVDPDNALCKVGFACLSVQQKQWTEALKALKSVEGTH